MNKQRLVTDSGPIAQGDLPWWSISADASAAWRARWPARPNTTLRVLTDLGTSQGHGGTLRYRANFATLVQPLARPGPVGAQPPGTTLVVEDRAQRQRYDGHSRRSRMAACPYNAPSPCRRRTTSTRPSPMWWDKCTFCFHRVTQTCRPVQTCIAARACLGTSTTRTARSQKRIATNPTQVDRSRYHVPNRTFFYIGAGSGNQTESLAILHRTVEVMDRNALSQTSFRNFNRVHHVNMFGFTGCRGIRLTRSTSFAGRAFGGSAASSYGLRGSRLRCGPTLVLAHPSGKLLGVAVAAGGRLVATAALQYPNPMYMHSPSPLAWGAPNTAAWYLLALHI